MAAAALAAAQLFVDGASQATKAKRPRFAPPGDGQSQVANSQDVLLTQLLRSHLLQANAVLDATNATQMVLLIKDEGDKKALVDLLNAWHHKQREIALTPEQRRAGHQQKPHEYGPRKVFLFHAALERLSKVAPLDCKDALEALLKMEDAVVDMSISSFGPEYSTPKEGRVWKWKVALSP